MTENEILDESSLPLKTREFYNTLAKVKKKFIFHISIFLFISIFIFMFGKAPLVALIPILIIAFLFIYSLTPRFVYYIEEKKSFIELYMLNIWSKRNSIKLQKSKIKTMAPHVDFLKNHFLVVNSFDEWTGRQLYAIKSTSALNKSKKLRIYK